MTITVPIAVFITDGPLGDPPPRPDDKSAGAWVVFEGVVRDEEDGRKLRALGYTAYEPMARDQLELLARSVQKTHNLLLVIVEHSRGEVPVGGCSFRLSVASGHRKEALAAMDEFIDRMKQDVPIWKAPVWQ